MRAFNTLWNLKDAESMTPEEYYTMREYIEEDYLQDCGCNYEFELRIGWIEGFTGIPISRKEAGWE